MPPISGAAIRFITSEPVPMDHMIGNRPRKVVAVVMNFGRRRVTAPCRTAVRRSARLRMRPSFLACA